MILPAKSRGEYKERIYELASSKVVLLILVFTMRSTLYYTN
jgi:hypothetical protein